MNPVVTFLQFPARISNLQTHFSPSIPELELLAENYGLIRRGCFKVAIMEFDCGEDDFLSLSFSFLTQHPQQAHMFFIPFSSEISTRSLSRLISRIREDFPYWNRSLGADHFYLSCAGIPNKNDRNNVELKKNAVQVSCFPTRRRRFVPHKDLTLPPISNLHAPVKSGGGDFCYVEYGNDMGEAMRLGCVPVVVVTEGGVTVNDMPFMDVLRWKEMVVFVKSGLKNDSDTWKKREENMKRLCVEGSKHLRWNRPPQPLDAFNTIMYQLWLRRHTVRYENVHTSYTQAII